MVKGQKDINTIMFWYVQWYSDIYSDVGLITMMFFFMTLVNSYTNTETVGRISLRIVTSLMYIR